MKRAKLNLIIDALLLLCLAAIAGIGLLIKYVLVPGHQRWEIYGRNVSLFLWGLDRHQWGTIHFIIGLVFLSLLVLHVVLHWSMVVGVYRRLIPNRFARCGYRIDSYLHNGSSLFFPLPCKTQSCRTRTWQWPWLGIGAV